MKCTRIAADDALTGVDAVVVASAGADGSAAESAWERILSEHTDVVDQIHTDARWARAVADHAAQSERQVRLVTLTDAATAGGRSRAQASAQLARTAGKTTGNRVAAFAISDERAFAGDASELVAHLLCDPDAIALCGAELVAGPGWMGLRSHPRPSTSITLGGTAIPDWFDDTVRSVIL